MKREKRSAKIDLDSPTSRAKVVTVQGPICVSRKPASQPVASLGRERTWLRKMSTKRS